MPAGRGRSDNSCKAIAIVAALVWCAVVGVRPTAAATAPYPVTPRFATASASVRAGDHVEIHWGSLPIEVDELELLLSVDGGRTYPLRVSPEIDGREISFLWRVPNLAVAAARMRLRMRLAGVEIESEAGPCFEIRFRPDVPRDYDLVHEGPWWTGPDGYETGDPRASMRPVGPRLQSGSPRPSAVQSPRSSVPEPTLSPPPPTGMGLVTSVEPPSCSFSTSLRFSPRRE